MERGTRTTGQETRRPRVGRGEDGVAPAASEVATPEAAPAYHAGEAASVPRRLRPITGPDDVREACRGLSRRRFEEFHVLLLNARHEVLRRVMISRGSLNASIVHPREVFRPAIIASAAAIVLVHNHPSGDPEPSEEDLAITRRLVQVGELHGIGVLDHVIMARNGIVSLRAKGLL